MKTRIAGAIALSAAVVICTACGGGANSGALQESALARPPSASTPIKNIVVIVQENRTFNNLFATFPGATGTTTGEMRIGTGSSAKTVPIALKKVKLEDKVNLAHIYAAYKTAYRGGNMDAFNLIVSQTKGKYEGKAPYEYVNPKQLAPYWDMAEQYVLAENAFQTQGSGSFTAHQDLIRGGTAIDSAESLIDDPTHEPWGCPAPAGTKTSIITTSLKEEKNHGPFPCTSDFPASGSYKTLQDLLDGAGVSWKYYTPSYQGNTGALWNAFLVISSVYGSQSEWNAHISEPETNIFSDISNGTLPAMSWVIPEGPNSDHPGYASDHGPSWVAGVVNAIGQSSYWDSTAIVIVWDDWGGFYDEVPPPVQDNQGGEGFRVPMIVISPYATPGQGSPPGYISNEQYSFGSIIRFVEDTFNLGRLGTTDATTNSIGPESGSQTGDTLNFNQAPRAFTTIPSKYSRSYFLHQKPSGLPPDTE